MKIVIIGPVASGKTTLAKELSELLGIPYYEMDKIVHDDDKGKKRSELAQRTLLNGIIKTNKEWIIEGMPRNHLEVLCQAATSVIYLDYQKNILKRRLRLRHIKQKIGLDKVDYKVDKELYQRMLSYIKNDQKDMLKDIMKKYQRKLYIIKNDVEKKKYLEALKEGEILKYQ